MQNSLRKSLNWVYWGGIAQSATDTFATGAIITTYALLLGANNIEIGILGAVPFIGNLMHIFAAYLLEKRHSVKKISIWSSFISRPFYLFAAMLVFFPSFPYAVSALILFLTAVYSIGNIAGGAWRPWMKELVPNRVMAGFFSARFKGMMIAKIVCSGLAFILLEYYKRYNPSHELYAYFWLLLLSFCINMFGAFTLTQVKDVKVYTPSTLSFFEKIMLCVKKKEFVRLMGALGYLNFIVNFVTPFFVVFLLVRLGLSSALIVFLTIFPQFVYVFAIKKIGKLSDKKGLPFMMAALLPAYMGVLAIFCLLNAVSLPVVLFWILLIFAHILLGVGQAAVALGSNNLSLLFIPKQQAPVYLAVNGTFIALIGAIGSIAGGVFMQTVQNYFAALHIANAQWYAMFGLAIIMIMPMIWWFKNLKKIS